MMHTEDTTLRGTYFQSQADEEYDDESKNSLIQSIHCSKFDHYKFAFITKGACMIYIGLSRNKYESVSFVKKQLEMLHLQLISITSRQVIEMLRMNPSFDLMGEMYTGLPLVRRMASGANKSLATFLNMFQPLKMTKQVADSVEFVVQRNKPAPESFYFGLLVAETTVVALFKSSQRTVVQPADINLLINFMTEHQRRLKKRAPCFFSICIPGLTEEFKMSVFFHTSNRISGQFGLRLVIVCEEANAQLMDKFENVAENIFQQLNLESTIERIDHLEKQMYTRMSK